MKPKFYIFICLAFAFVSVSAISVKNQTTALSRMNPPHNLKVLPKNLTSEQIHQIMKGYSKALGVKCSYCHAISKTDSTKLDFASDEIFHKHIARDMIVMTEAINKKYFKSRKNSTEPTEKIDCMTCHNGQKKPYTVKVD